MATGCQPSASPCLGCCSGASFTAVSFAAVCWEPDAAAGGCCCALSVVFVSAPVFLLVVAVSVVLHVDVSPDRHKDIIIINDARTNLLIIYFYGAVIHASLFFQHFNIIIIITHIMNMHCYTLYNQIQISFTTEI